MDPDIDTERYARPRKRALSSDSEDSESGHPASSGGHGDLQSMSSDDMATSSKFNKVDDSSASRSGAQAAYVCSLPPLCSLRLTSFPTSAALESHYASHHAHTCSEVSCRKIFPDEHFLSLHLREFHDPIVAILRERGQRTYSCFVPTCTRKFSSPKKRRLHLVDFHKYPAQYFFALPQHGLEQLYSRYGSSASLVGPSRQATHSHDRERPTTGPDATCSKSASLASAGMIVNNKPDHRDDKLSATIAFTKGSSPVHNKYDDREDESVKIHTRMERLALVPPVVQFGRARGQPSRAKLVERPNDNAHRELH